MITSVLRHAVRPLRYRLACFTSEEDGSIVPLMAVFFLLMVLTGGIAVDVMRFETKRVAVQNTLDRSTLAAASMTQTLEPVDVVNDYFERAGLESNLEDVRVQRGANFRIVDAEATVVSKNFFMSMMDQPTLAALTASQAEQRISNVEIIMVLDISGSMAGSKLTNLKTAARQFVDTMKANDSEDRISIGIVPYNAQVNAGTLLRDKFNFTHNNGNSAYTCVEFPHATYSQTSLSRVQAIPMMAAADVGSGTSTANEYVDRTSTASATPALSATTAWCDGNSRSYILMPTTDGETVKTAIGRLTANGNTSIAIGMRWGTALISPEARSIYTELIGANQMDPKVAGRPTDFSDEETIKVIILMTDGEHVSHSRIVDAYKSGTSPIFRNGSDGNYSLYSNRANTNDDYWVPHLGRWQNAPHGGSSAARLDWTNVWSRQRLTWVAWQLYGRSGVMTNSAFLNAARQSYASEGTMNTLLTNNCSAARNAGVRVYAIAFAAPAAGQTVMRNCASKPESTYYLESATPDSIQRAFAAIASNLSQLRLTQ